MRLVEVAHLQMTSAAKQELRKFLLALGAAYPYAKWSQEPMKNWHPRYRLKGADVDGVIEIEYQNLGDTGTSSLPQRMVRNWYAATQLNVKDLTFLAKMFDRWGSEIHAHSEARTPGWHRANADVLLDREQLVS